MAAPTASHPFRASSTSTLQAGLGLVYTMQKEMQDLSHLTDEDLQRQLQVNCLSHHNLALSPIRVSEIIQGCSFNVP